jgi:oligopeptide transport system ATP-binding protein
LNTVAPLVKVTDLHVHFPIMSTGVLPRQVGTVRAVDGVSFTINKGETLGLVGESGCGKSTTGRGILQLIRPTSGSVLFEGTELTSLAGSDLRKVRARAQMVFQDPYSSLNPRMTVGRIIGEPLAMQGLEKEARDERVRELLSTVGMAPQHAGRYPHAFSGGQRQRIGIARALAMNPSFVVLDEPIAALDVSIQAQILNLIAVLQKEFSLTFLLIAHDLSAVRHMSDRVAVMYLGRMVEMAPVDELFDNPIHPYTKALMSAVPIPEPAVERNRPRIILEGDVSIEEVGATGCRFRARCPFANDACSVKDPVLTEIRSDHLVEYCCDQCIAA